MPHLSPPAANALHRKEIQAKKTSVAKVAGEPLTAYNGCRNTSEEAPHAQTTTFTTTTATGPLSDPTPLLLDCPECQHRTYADYKNYRTISTLDSVFRLTLTIRRCPNPECSRLLRPYRPEAESHFALPYHEFGLDVMARAHASQ